MASLEPLAEAERYFSAPSRRMMTLGTLRAIEAAGGSLESSEAKRKVTAFFGDLLNPSQEEVLRTKRLGWCRTNLRNLGLLAKDTPNSWTLTPLGREYLQKFRNVALEAPPNLVNSESELKQETDTVPVTERTGFEIPLLRALAEGGSVERSELYQKVKTECAESLLPGDFLTLPGGDEVLSNRMGWALSNLKNRGEAQNPSRGNWMITEQGQARLDRESATWSLAAYQHSKAAVLRGTPPPPEIPAHSVWQSLELELGSEKLQAIRQRLQIELGPIARKVSRNLILYGPPGTGKTHLAKQLAVTLSGDAGPGADKRWRVVQFHPSYAYEDFVQGIRPVLGGSGLNYQLIEGPLLTISTLAGDDPENFYVLVIDEINRGDPAKIFGEALYALEYRGETIDLAVGGSLNIPSNLIVIGTMNSVDRSVALVDYALRRRFGFVRLAPEPELVARLNVPGAEAAAVLLEQFNQWLVQQLDEEHALGHSFFLGCNDLRRESLERIWRSDWLPLLEEYFFNDQQRLSQARAAWENCLKIALSEASEA